jgi:hypothetical protein
VNEKNIEDLKTQLLQLGFDASIETELRCRICFSPAGFELIRKINSGSDVSRFAVQLENGERDMYRLIFYQASLRKEIVVPVELTELDEKMLAINWLGLAGSQFNSLDKTSVGQAYNLLKQLETLGAAGDVLKFKHWVDTPLENLLPNLAALKSRYEISDRFYLLDVANLIPFSEANRFLYSKWLERQMVASKKLLVKKTESPQSAGVASGNC